MSAKRRAPEAWATWLEELSEDIQDVGENELDDSEDDDHLSICDYDTDSEIEADDDDEFHVEASPVYYTGKDGATVWTSAPYTSGIKQEEYPIHSPQTKGKGTDIKTFLDSFSCIIDDNIIHLITINTNLNIERIKSNFSQQRDASPTNEIEIAALLGILFLTGLKNPGRGNVQELWDQNGLGIEACYLTMSYKRFTFLLRCLRFDDPRDVAQRRELDKLAPMREILQLFVHNCQRSFSPGELLTIDEQLVPFRGKCPFRQYAPNKPGKCGIKMFLLVDTKTMYTNNVEIFIAKQPEGPFREKNEPADIVARLVRPITGTNRNVTFGSWFTDVNLAMDLLKNHQITCVGSLNNKKMEIPTVFTKTRGRELYSSIFGFLKNENCSLVSYIPDNGKVILGLSTKHTEPSIDITTEPVKPTVISFYNNTKGVVNELAKMCTVYSVARMSRRWPLAVFYRLLNIAGINGITIHKANNPIEKITRAEYLKGLALELIKPQIADRLQKHTIRKSLKRKISNFLGLGGQETPGLPPVKRGSNTPGRCSVCSRGRDRKTRVCCDRCQKFICKEHYVIICVRCVQDQREVVYSSEED